MADLVPKMHNVDERGADDPYQYCFEKHLLGKTAPELEDYLVNRFSSKSLAEGKRNFVKAYPLGGQLSRDEEPVDFFRYAISAAVATNPSKFYEIVDFAQKKVEFLENLLDATNGVLDESLGYGTEDYATSLWCTHILIEAAKSGSEINRKKIHEIAKKYMDPEDTRLAPFKDYDGAGHGNVYELLRQVFDFTAPKDSA